MQFKLYFVTFNLWLRILEFVILTFAFNFSVTPNYVPPPANFDWEEKSSIPNSVGTAGGSKKKTKKPGKKRYEVHMN